MLIQKTQDVQVARKAIELDALPRSLTVCWHCLFKLPNAQMERVPILRKRYDTGDKYKGNKCLKPN